jgi:hypothetical protein
MRDARRDQGATSSETTTPPEPPGCSLEGDGTEAKKDPNQGGLEPPVDTGVGGES